MNKKGIMKTTNRVSDVAVDKYEKSKMFLLVLFFMSGLAMIFAGFWAELKLNRFLQFTTKHSYAPSYVLIGTGIIVICAGFFACCWSSDKGNPVIMYACSVSLFLVVVLEVSAAVAMLVFRKTWIENFDNGMKDAITKYKKFTPYFDTQVDSFQIALKCCGDRTYNDWLNLNPPVPQSCCIKTSCDVNDVSKIYQEGCYEKVVAFFNNNVKYLAVGIAVLAVFPLLGIIICWGLARGGKKSKYQQVK